MNLELEGQTAFVAASSRGIGKASARRLAQEGASVTLTGRKQAALTTAREEILTETDVDPSQVLTQQCDITERAEITAAVDETVDTFGGLDILVNNHGGPPAVSFADAGDSQWDDAYELVIKSNVWLSEAAIPHLDASDHGAIVTVTSASAQESTRNHALSNVFRLGLYGLTKTLAKEYAPSIRANCVAPRYVMTERIEYKIQQRAEYENISEAEAASERDEEVLLNRPGDPAEFADTVAFVASPRASYTTGDVIRVDGGWKEGVL